MRSGWAVLLLVMIQGCAMRAEDRKSSPGAEAPAPAYPCLAADQRAQRAREVMDPTTDEQARFQAVWGLAISGYTPEGAEALGMIAADRNRNETLREYAAMGLINFTPAMPHEVRAGLEDKLLGALGGEREKLPGGGIQLLVRWGHGDRVYEVFGEKMRDHPMEVIVLKGISSRRIATDRLWEIYQEAAPARSGNIALSRAWHAGEALIHWKDKRGIDILIECLIVSGESGDEGESFRQSRHNTFMHLSAALGKRFGYEGGGTWNATLGDAIPSMAQWWKVHRETWSFGAADD